MTDAEVLEACEDDEALAKALLEAGLAGKEQAKLDAISAAHLTSYISHLTSHILHLTSYR